ncbi:MAG: hypothetical protein Q7T63_22100 [Burkholderiaceae bacterium]|nr:hypothetical protein [Burkholderiaceae bacterium]MDO9089223.1 hypothetical protein [Burkholderiaceae bacterium]
MTKSKQMNSDALNLSEGVVNKPLPTMALHCYLIRQEDREPDEDEMVDEEQEFTGMYFYAASSKEHALELQVQALLDKGFYELEVDRRSDPNIPEWTDDWTNATLSVYSMDESGFWECLGWDEEIWGDELVAWAGKNMALASQLLMAAKAGQGPGHQAVAKHAGLLSVVEQAELQQEVLAKEGSKKSRTSSSI